MARKSKQAEPANTEVGEKFADDKKLAADAVLSEYTVAVKSDKVVLSGLKFAPGQFEEIARFVDEKDELTITIKAKEPNLRIAPITCRSVKLKQYTHKTKGTVPKFENLQIPKHRQDDLHSYVKNETPLIVTLSLYQKRLPVAEEDSVTAD